MRFESLCSDVLFEIYDYLDDIDIIRGFNINQRFKNVILAYFHTTHRLNLRSVQKTQLKLICDNYLSNLTEDVDSICLSNDRSSPQQIDLLDSYGFRLNIFSKLKSLTLHSIESNETINGTISQLKSLERLRIIECEISNNDNYPQRLIDSIWNLPQLTHCQLDISVKNMSTVILPTIISTSLQYLSIINCNYQFHQVYSLLNFTPHLQYLNISIEENTTEFLYSLTCPLIRKLKLQFTGSVFNELRRFLQNFPNLSTLSIETTGVCIEGDEWEHLIQNYLPQLNIFHFLMEYHRTNSGFLVENLVSTYQTDFWVQQRRWYIQGYCYCYPRLDTIVLYTLPYKFETYHIHSPSSHMLSGINSANYMDSMIHENVHTLVCDSIPNDKFQFRCQFINVRNLTLSFPVNDNIWTFLSTFRQLKELNLYLSHRDEFYETNAIYLEDIFQRAPKLKRLKFCSSIESSLAVLEIPSSSVVELDFSELSGPFDTSNCSVLCLSSLGKQCEILTICVSERTCIILLVKNMLRLRTLNVECSVEANEYDKIIKWLQYHLPSHCRISRNSLYPDLFHICIY